MQWYSRVVQYSTSVLQYVVVNYRHTGACSGPPMKKAGRILRALWGTPSFAMVPVWYLAETIYFLPGILLVRTGTKNGGSCMNFCEKSSCPLRNRKLATWTNSQSTTMKKRKVRQMWSHVPGACHGKRRTYVCTGRALKTAASRS